MSALCVHQLVISESATVVLNINECYGIEDYKLAKSYTKTSKYNIMRKTAP